MINPVFGSLIEPLEKRGAVLVGQHRMVQIDFRQPGDRTQDDVLDARLRRRCDGDRIAVTTEAGCDPQHVHLAHSRRMLRPLSVRNTGTRHEDFPLSGGPPVGNGTNL